MAIIKVEDINTEENVPCTCGRSTTGICDNSHLLTQEQFDSGLKMVIEPAELEDIRAEKEAIRNAQNASKGN